MDKPRARAFLVGAGVSLATAILMLATEPSMAIGWDEGYTLGREARLRDWFQALRDPARLRSATGSRCPPIKSSFKAEVVAASRTRPARHAVEAAPRPGGPRMVLAVRA